ncbi:hypothetical protein EXIGLDRAFT_728014 [Exidia glandulosa HHB12029]|uniref:Uncharacterized protein n=1 Tax=Exidia glandulosa HHB12029 TaxID=1314781 RepID=A0A165D3W0_EXIGL|nr:hypothetical protein EXIGLDRAFT_728014 [Exidia glandulosa HHB12029]
MDKAANWHPMALATSYLDQASNLIVHPNILHHAAALVRKHAQEATITIRRRLVLELLANPAVDERTADLRGLLQLDKRDYHRRRILQQHSHARAIAELRVASELEEGKRLAQFSQIVHMRFADAPVMSSDDFFAALNLFPSPNRIREAVTYYLRSFVPNLIHLCVAWESEFADAWRERAAQYLRVLELYLLETDSLHDANTHRALLAAYGATRCAAYESQLHWEWLLEHGQPLGQRTVQYAFTAARDVDALRRIWAETRAAQTTMKAYPPNILSPTEGQYAHHLLRFGEVAEAKEIHAGKDPDETMWAFNAHEALAGGEWAYPRVTGGSKQVFFARKNIKRAMMLASPEIGMDFEALIFWLGPLSPAFETLRGTRNPQKPPERNPAQPESVMAPPSKVE